MLLPYKAVGASTLRLEHLFGPPVCLPACAPLFCLCRCTSVCTLALCAGHVVFYDLDGKLDIVRLMEVG